MTFTDRLTAVLFAALLASAFFHSLEGACSAVIVFCIIHLMRVF